MAVLLAMIMVLLEGYAIVFRDRRRDWREAHTFFPLAGP